MLSCFIGGGDGLLLPLAFVGTGACCCRGSALCILSCCMWRGSGAGGGGAGGGAGFFLAAAVWLGVSPPWRVCGCAGLWAAPLSGSGCATGSGRAAAPGLACWGRAGGGCGEARTFCIDSLTRKTQRTHTMVAPSHNRQQKDSLLYHTRGICARKVSAPGKCQRTLCFRQDKQDGDEQQQRNARQTRITRFLWLKMYPITHHLMFEDQKYGQTWMHRLALRNGTTPSPQPPGR